MNYREFQGYKIFEDGSIMGKRNRYIQPIIKINRKEVRLYVEGKAKHYMVARLVYYVFNSFDISDKNLCVVHKNGDTLDCHIQNLELKHRSDLIQGEKHKKRAKLTNKQVEEIRSLYNGKSGSNQYNKEGWSMKDLAQKYNVTKSNIAAIIRNESRNEDEYILKKSE